MTIRAKLYAAIALTILGPLLTTTVALEGQARLGESFDEVQQRADDAALAQDIKFDVTDMNGWQTAYGYAGDGRFRSEYVTARDRLNRNLTTRLLYQRLLDLVIVTGGELTRRALIERDGLASDRVAAFPIGIDVGLFKPGTPTKDLREELGLSQTHLLVGLISYLRSYKGHEYFIDAAARIAVRDRDVTFVVVGQGPEEARLRARIQEQGVGHSVRMLGYRDDLLNVFHSLDVFVIPSVEGDTIPQVLMQAMAVGLPVVSTTVGSIPDVVRNGETGFVVPPRDAASLADRIRVLLNDGELRSQLGRAGRALVERHYSLDRMLDELERVYRRAADRVAGGA